MCTYNGVTIVLNYEKHFHIPFKVGKHYELRQENEY